MRAEPKQFLVLTELTVIARTDPDLTDLARWERTQYIGLIAELLGKWWKDTPPEALRNWAAVILAGIDGLIDGRLTARDDETTDAAATLFASSVGAAVRSATADRP